MAPPAGDAEFVAVGRVGKAHGVKGGFYVDGVSDEGALQVGTTVSIAGQLCDLLTRGGMRERPLISVSGINDRTAAEAIRNQPILVNSEVAAPLADDEWMIGDLVGLKVFDLGSEIGAVVGVINAPSADILEVAPGEGEVLLVPFIHDAVRLVDIAAGRIEVDGQFLGLR